MIAAGTARRPLPEILRLDIVAFRTLVIVVVNVVGIGLH